MTHTDLKVLYGSATVMMLSTGSGVHSFTLDPNYGEFILANSNLYVACACVEVRIIFCAKQRERERERAHARARGGGEFSAMYL